MANKKKSSASGSAPSTPKSNTPAPFLSAQPASKVRPQQTKIARKTLHRTPRHVGPFERVLLWFESTFALTMLEPWEKSLVYMTMAITSFFLYFAVVHYLPDKLLLLSGRAKFYLYGPEGSI